MSPVKAFSLGSFSTILAAIACAVYNRIYSEAFYVDFGKVIGLSDIIAACAISCFLMASAYTIGFNWKGEQTIRWLNILFSVLSFISIIGVLGYNLPLDIEFPEMFPGLVIPMHFFPVLSFLTIYPFYSFKNNL